MRFISIGENIHCTRIFKVGGKRVITDNNGNDIITYHANGETRHLPIPAQFKDSANWEAGKIKHCAVAIHQGINGSDANKAAGVDYLQNMARRQEAAGACYLDLNVDEYSTDVDERVGLMKWLVETVQKASSTPLSIDSSNIQILRAGLEACDRSKAKPMINSVSLERVNAIPLVKEFKTVVVASAAGEKNLPTAVEDKMKNLARLMPLLSDAGLGNADIHIDPLVFPIATDSGNGMQYFNSARAIRSQYGADIHISGGLSNISFGMPKRNLINLVFSHLAVEAGADGGIVDPLHINDEALAALDTSTESYSLTKALLMGEDDFGMNYIMASREDRI